MPTLDALDDFGKKASMTGPFDVKKICSRRHVTLLPTPYGQALSGEYMITRYGTRNGCRRFAGDAMVDVRPPSLASQLLQMVVLDTVLDCRRWGGECAAAIAGKPAPTKGRCGYGPGLPGMGWWMCGRHRWQASSYK